MPILFQWNLLLRYGVPVGVGIVSGHPRLTEGTNIHTSPIIHTAKVENSLQMKTASGNIYYLQMKEWRLHSSKADPLNPELLGLPSDFWTQCAHIREKTSQSEKADIQPFIKPGTLYMRIVGTHILSAFWSGMDSRIRDTTIRIHLGMFQDSYRIASAYEESSTLHQVDFRLFPMLNRPVQIWIVAPTLST